MNLIEAVEYTRSIREKQYATGKVGALDFKYLPKEKQLWIAGQALSSLKHKVYKVQLVFEGITNSPTGDTTHVVPYSSKDNGVDLYLSRPTVNTRIRTRCQCQDYYYMFEFFNKRTKALIGPHKNYVRVSPPSGRPPVNPEEVPGLCKHILAMVKVLMVNNVLARDSIVWPYVTQLPR